MLTFGSAQGSIPLAAVGAGAAVVLVVAAGVVVRAPLARVPENTMKFAVGVMLTTFGIFWGAEGAGVDWPGDDAALPAFSPSSSLMSLGYVTCCGAGGGGSRERIEALRPLLVGLRRRRRLACRGGRRRRVRPDAPRSPRVPAWWLLPLAVVAAFAVAVGGALA